MNGNASPAQFLEKRRLSESRDFRRLPQRGFLRDKQADRRMQNCILWRQPGFDRCWQRKVQGQRMNANPAFRKRLVFCKKTSRPISRDAAFPRCAPPSTCRRRSRWFQRSKAESGSRRAEKRSQRSEVRGQKSTRGCIATERTNEWGQTSGGV